MTDIEDVIGSGVGIEVDFWGEGSGFRVEMYVEVGVVVDMVVAVEA